MLKHRRWMLWGIGLLFCTLFIGGGALYCTHRVLHRDYNCLNLNNQLQVQLNTRLSPVPEVIHAVSPDGQYQIVSTALSRDQRRLLLRNTHSGTDIGVKSALAEVQDVVWSPDSQLAAFYWRQFPHSDDLYITMVNAEEEQTDDVVKPDYRLGTVSFDHKYVAQQAIFHNLSILSTSNESYHFAATGYAWSPVDNRLAYVTTSEVVVIDLDNDQTHRVPNSFGRPADYPYHTDIVWSPDGRYFAVEHYQIDRIEGVVSIYSTENSQLTDLLHFNAYYRHIGLSVFLKSLAASSGRYITFFRTPFSYIGHLTKSCMNPKGLLEQVFE